MITLEIKDEEKTKRYKVKPIEPCDFLESEAGCPFNIFYTQKNMGVYEKMQAHFQEEHGINEQQVFPIIESVFSKIIDKRDKHNEDFDLDRLHMEHGFSFCFNMFLTILDKSTLRFKKMYKVKKNLVLYIDQTAKRYGKLPIEILCQNGEYNALDAYLFNTFVFNVSITNENDQAKAKQRRDAWQIRR